MLLMYQFLNYVFNLVAYIVDIDTAGVFFNADKETFDAFHSLYAQFFADDVLYLDVPGYFIIDIKSADSQA